MFEYVLDSILENPFDVVTTLIAIIGVVLWKLDRRSMKAALQATKRADINTLRLRKQRTDESAVESFISLKTQCDGAREGWRELGQRSALTIRSKTIIPKSTISEKLAKIGRIESEGRKLLHELRSSWPEEDNIETDALESYYSQARQISLEFANLASEIPKPDYHFN